MISLTLIILASACNALIDTLAHHFHKSIFTNIKDQFWNPSLSWRNKYIDGKVLKGHRMIWIFKYPVQLTDAWHLFKFIMLALLIAAVVVYKPLLSPVLDFFILGIAWVLVFNLCYNKLFVRG